MLPSEYPVVLGVEEKATDWIRVENCETNESHFLGDWNGVLEVKVRVSGKKGIERKALTSGLISDLAKNPENSENWLGILRGKLKRLEKAKANKKSERIVYKVGRCVDQ